MTGGGQGSCGHPVIQRDGGAVICQLCGEVVSGERDNIPTDNEDLPFTGVPASPTPPPPTKDEPLRPVEGSEQTTLNRWKVL